MMRWLRRTLDRQERRFRDEGRWARWRPLYDAVDTLLFSPGTVARGAPYVRDAIDLKRIMIIVVIALLPSIAMAFYNTGLQAHRLIEEGGMPLSGWRTDLFVSLGFGFESVDVLGCLVHGGLYFVPVLIVGFVSGIGVELLFAIVRRHEVNEGFFVTAFLLPLILPPTIPLWQVALATAFGVLFGKEVFGGTGMNFLNPALVCRAFLFFAYPAQMSGEVWVAAQSLDAVSSATPLASLAEGLPIELVPWTDAFWGTIPGSMGETSAVACSIGVLLLVWTQVASWRTVLGVIGGSAAMAFFLNAVGSATNPMFAVPFHYHIVLGGWAFGAAFMATDPVTSPLSERGRWVYGVWVGALMILIRVVNPAYPEGTMLALLLMNLFAPLIDQLVVRAHIRRRQRRYADFT